MHGWGRLWDGWGVWRMWVGREGYVREGGQGGLCLLGNPTVTGGCLRMAGARTHSGGGSSFLGSGNIEDGGGRMHQSMSPRCSELRKSFRISQRIAPVPVFLLARALEAAPPELSVLWPAARMNPPAAAGAPQDKARPGPLRGRRPHCQTASAKPPSITLTSPIYSSQWSPPASSRQNSPQW